MVFRLTSEMEYPPTGTDEAVIRAGSDWAVLPAASVSFMEM